MAVWDEQNMIALSIESTKEIVYEFIVIIKSGTDKTKEVVEWCRDNWNLNIRIIETDIKLREARKLAVELTKDYADYYLIQDGDEIYFTEKELKDLGRLTITDLMDQSYDHCETTIIYLYNDLLHTKIDNTWLMPHPFLIKNLPEIFWPDYGDLPYLIFDWQNKKYKLFNSNIVYNTWKNGFSDGKFIEKSPFKFDCNIKNYSRLFKRLVFTKWHDGDNNCTIEEYCFNNDSRCEWYKNNIKRDTNLDEIISFFEINESLNYLEKYDESKFYVYPNVIKKYIECGLVKGINQIEDLKNKKIKLFYYKTEEFGNFGDNLSRYIVEKISGQKVHHYFSPDTNTFNKMLEPNLLSTGSIINFANKNSFIWGSGLIDNGWSSEWQINKIVHSSITCVRGPITAQKLKEKMNLDVTNFGDPSLLIKNFYNPKIEKKFTLGIIPHINDESFVESKMINNDKVKLISLKCKDNNQMIEEKIKEMLECNLIISSSLHGLIVPIVYDIPSMYFRRIRDSYEQDITDDYHNEILTKYKDFFQSVYYDGHFPEIKINWSDFSLETIKNSFINYKYPTLITNRMNDLFESYPFSNLSCKKIYFISTLIEESSHFNFVLKNSKFNKNIIVTSFSDTNKLKFNQEDIYFINCLGSSDIAKFFLDLKDKHIIKTLILHNSGNVDFLPIEILNKFDLIFYETLYSYKMSYLQYHKNNLRAFGINTDIFKNLNLPKQYDYIWVGSINDELKKFTEIPKLIDDKESKIIMIGDIYTKEDQDKLDKLTEQGYNIEIKPRSSLRELNYFYNISKCLLITQPEYGGGERCLLEAKYCGLDIKILNNTKLSELNEEEIVFDLDYFTSQIDKGIEIILNSNL